MLDNLLCKVLGHKWEHYKSDIEYEFSSPDFKVMINTSFRICDRCSHKDKRSHYTGRKTDWETYELTKEELRNKKLKKLIG